MPTPTMFQRTLPRVEDLEKQALAEANKIAHKKVSELIEKYAAMKSLCKDYEDSKELFKYADNEEQADKLKEQYSQQAFDGCCDFFEFLKRNGYLEYLTKHNLVKEIEINLANPLTYGGVLPDSYDPLFAIITKEMVNICKEKEINKILNNFPKTVEDKQEEKNIESMPVLSK